MSLRYQLGHIIQLQFPVAICNTEEQRKVYSNKLVNKMKSTATFLRLLTILLRNLASSRRIYLCCPDRAVCSEREICCQDPVG